MPLPAGRRLAELTGAIDEIAPQADTIGDAIVKVTVDIPVPDPHLADAVPAALPDATIARVEPRCATSTVTILGRDTALAEEPDLTDMFRECLATVGAPGAVAAHVLATSARILADAHRLARAYDPQWLARIQVPGGRCDLPR